MPDVFISYKREDRAVADRVVTGLKRLGFEVWWDFDVLSGETFRPLVEQMIDSSGATVVLWSKLSRGSRFVIDEVNRAANLDRLCPAMIEPCEPPMGFGQMQTADIVGWNGDLDHHGFRSLVRGIELKTGKKAHEQAPPTPAVAQTELQELQAFKTAATAGTPEALRVFLEAFPASSLAAVAKTQLAALTAPKPAPPPPPPPAPPPPSPPPASQATAQPHVPPQASRSDEELRSDQVKFLKGMGILAIFVLALIGLIALLPR
jgi:hypothetical protein